MSIGRVFQFIAVVCALIGVAGIPDDMARWSSWIGAIAPYVNQSSIRWAIFITAMGFLFGPQLFVRLKGSPYKDKRDVTACEAISYIATQSKMVRQTKSKNPFLDAVRAFERAALDGDIEIWGRQEASADYEQIDRRYWETAELDIIDCQNPNGTGGKTMAKGIDGTRGADDILARQRFKTYIGLRVERKQIEALWPRSVRRTWSLKRWLRKGQPQVIKPKSITSEEKFGVATIIRHKATLRQRVYNVWRSIFYS